MLFVVYIFCVGAVYVYSLLKMGTMLCVVAMETLSTQASSRVADAFRPKTRRAYTMMFKVFIAFCIIMKIPLSNVSVKVLI